MRVMDQMGDLFRCGCENTNQRIESLKDYSAVTDSGAASSRASGRNPR